MIENIALDVDTLGLTLGLIVGVEGLGVGARVEHVPSTVHDTEHVMVAPLHTRDPAQSWLRYTVIAMSFAMRMPNRSTSYQMQKIEE